MDGGRGPRRLHGHRGAEGFTLVEVAVALVILSMGLLGVAGMITQASAALRRAAHTDEAVRAVASVADSLRTLPRAADGSRDQGRIHVSWTASAVQGGALVHVTGRPAAGGAAVEVVLFVPSQGK